jgi:hypothetical protein
MYFSYQSSVNPLNTGLIYSFIIGSCINPRRNRGKSMAKALNRRHSHVPAPLAGQEETLDLEDQEIIRLSLQGAADSFANAPRETLSGTTTALYSGAGLNPGSGGDSGFGACWGQDQEPAVCKWQKLIEPELLCRDLMEQQDRWTHRQTLSFLFVVSLGFWGAIVLGAGMKL